MRTLEISEETYEKTKDQLQQEEKENLVVEEGRDMMVRTYSAGVFMGRLKSIKDKTAVLNDAIRIWYWDGACSLSQLAMEGTKSPDNCKFAVPVIEILLNDVIEVIAVTSKASEQIRGIKSWKK